MFYQSADLSSVLLCSYCQSPFARGLAKSLPCGESICVACSDALLEANKPSRAFRFVCKSCAEPHDMPKRGLPDNARLIKLLGLESRPVSRGRQADRLRRHVEELQALADELSFELANPGGSVKRYFDKIRLDVERAHQRAVELCGRLKLELLEQVDECEADWQKKTGSAAGSTSLATPDVVAEDVRIATPRDKSVRFDELLIEVAAFARKWQERFRSCRLDEDEVDRDLQTANTLRARLGKSLVEHQRRIFNDRFLKFQASSSSGNGSEPGLRLGELCYFDSQNKKLDYVSTAQNMIFSMVLLGPDELASGASDGEIQVWRISTGELVRTLRGHSKPVYTLAVLANSARLVSGSFDRSIRMWDAGAGVQVSVIEDAHLDWISALAALPSAVSTASSAHSTEGDLASGSHDKLVKIWSSADGRLVRTLADHTASVWCLAVLKDGNLASGSRDETVKIWSPASGALLRTLVGHSGCLNSLAVLENGFLASGSNDNTIKVWNVDETGGSGSGGLVTTLVGHRSCVRSLAPLADGTLASAAYDNTVKIWNVHSAQPLLRTLSFRTNGVGALVALPGAAGLAVGTSPKVISVISGLEEGTVGTRIRSFKHHEPC